MAKNHKNTRLNTVSTGTEAIIHIMIGLFSLCCIIPFIFVIIIAFSSEQSIREIGYSFWPTQWSTATFAYAFGKLPQIWRSFFNSVFITVVGTLASTTMCALYSYALYRPDFKFRNFFTFFSFFTMIFGGGLIPTYLQVNALGIANTRWAMILPKLIITFNLIILRTGFEAVPASLEESARLDGANEFQIMTRIVVPLSLPTVAILILYYAVGHWNTWFTAMLYLQDRKLYPIQLILREILFISSTSGGASASDLYAETIKYASIIVTTVPILFIYPAVQRYFVKGMMVGAVKG